MIRVLPKLLCLLLIAALFTGCVDDGPKRKNLKPPPADLHPSKLGVWATHPEDTNSNGYWDTVEITVYLWSDEYVAPFVVPGTFEFRLLGPKGTEYSKWTFTEDQAKAAVRRMSVGPGYRFRLSMLDVGTDEIDAHEATLTAEFRPRNGAAIRAPSTDLVFGKSR